MNHRTITTPRAVLAGALLALCALLGTVAVVHVVAELHGPTSSVCVEDMPCWDCSTMGNRRCGR